MSERQELIEKYLLKMKIEVETEDAEIAHGNADDILCELLDELGFEEITIAFSHVKKWYA